MKGLIRKAVGNRNGGWCAAAILLAHPWPAAAEDQAPFTNAEMDEASGGKGPVEVEAAYFFDVFANVRGGIAKGATYQARLGLLLNVDLDKLVGWRGAVFHASLHQIHGTPVTPDRVGALNVVTGLEAEPNTRLNNLWIEQKIGTASLRLGQFTAAQEFLVSGNASLFINSTFGWPTASALDLPSGGPAYPIATPGIRLQIEAKKRTKLRIAIFNGDPAGPGSGDPQQRDADGLNSLRIAGPPFLIGEFQHESGASSGDPSTTIRLGAWYYFGKVSDQRYPASAAVIGTPGSHGTGERRSGNYQVYAIVDHRLVQSGPRSVDGFMRLAASPSDRNLVDASLDAGLSIKGLLQGRSDDVVGIAFSHTHLSSGPVDGTSGAPDGFGRRRAETVFELTYHLQAGQRWYLQPDVQFILRPGGNYVEPSPASQAKPRNALVVGVRNVLRF